MGNNQYDSKMPVCEQKRASCNRARKQTVTVDGEEVTVYRCEVLQDTHFNKPCPFFKESGSKK
jgi:hypothetical protein